MLQRIFPVIILSSIAINGFAQVKPIAPTATPVAAPAAKPLNFKTTASGIMYAFAVDKPGSVKPQEGDQIRVHMRSVASGRLLYDSYQANKGKPAEFGMTKASFKGDIAEVLAFMSVGDSLVAAVDADKVYNNVKNKKPEFIKKGDKIEYQVRLISIKTKDQLQKEQQALMNKQIQEQLAKQKKDQEKMKLTDEKNLQAYFKKNNLTPTKTSSGLYYTMTEPSAGPKPKTNDKVKMNYSGFLLDGTPFDSNVDTAFGHMSPFEFTLGTGQVIKGWDEGVALLSIGAKATFYIPSSMAYGANARPGSGANPKGIPANSPLVFNVELLDFSAPVNEALLLEDYFKKNNIAPTKTASGLYYKIKEEGKGPLPKAGQNVVMNYTGMLVDGTKFDSNLDSLFGHVSPFEFPLGQNRVIKGWDEGIALLKEGTKATLYIPSNLAYGATSMPGSAANPKGIPANSILIFDVELVKIKSE